MLKLRPWEFWLYTPADLYCASEGYRKLMRTDLEGRALLACWIVNQSGWRGGKPLRVKDLIYPESTEEKQLTSEEARKEIEDIAWQHKQKFWGKIGDKYIKKEDE